jgi:hypothetical protein
MALLAPYFRNDALADDEVQMRSIRQFCVALVVGLSLFALAGLIGARSPQIVSDEPPQSTPCCALVSGG